MLRSMYSAISGMQAFQTDLDVVGNNIANVNTTGFKTSRVDFSNMLSQTIAGSSAPNPSSGFGGVNAQQVGLGVQTSGIQTLFSPGSDETTGNATDLAINGSGLFVVSPNSTVTVGSLTAVPPTPDTTTTGTLAYTRAGDFSVDANGNLVLPNGYIAMGYDSNTPASTTGPDTTGKLAVMNLNSMLANYNVANHTNYTLGSTSDIQIGQDGSVQVGVLDGSAQSNITIGNIAVANFSNPSGLESVGSSLYQDSPSAGPASYTQPTEFGSGAVLSGELEASNVDLTQQFSEMIVAQNGFDANSKMIGTDNSILQDVVSMKNS